MIHKKLYTATEKARQGVIDSAAELPAAAHIKMAQALDGADKALRIFRATVQDLAPNTKLAARVEDDLEPLLRPHGKLDTLRAYLDSGFNEAVTDEQFNALGGLPGLYYKDGRTLIPTHNEYPADLDPLDGKAWFRNGFPDLLRQIEKGGDIIAAGEGTIRMPPNTLTCAAITQTKGKRFLRYLFSDDSAWGFTQPPALPDASKASQSVLLGGAFTIEFMYSGANHIIVFVASKSVGHVALHFRRIKDGPWTMFPYQLHLKSPTEGDCRYDLVLCLETYGSLLVELGYEYFNSPLNEHDREHVGDRCFRLAGDPMPDEQRQVLQLASNFSRWLAYFASQGQLWMKKVPNGSRHPQVKAAYFAGPEPGTA